MKFEVEINEYYMIRKFTDNEGFEFKDRLAYRGGRGEIKSIDGPTIQEQLREECLDIREGLIVAISENNLDMIWRNIKLESYD